MLFHRRSYKLSVLANFLVAVCCLACEGSNHQSKVAANTGAGTGPHHSVTLNWKPSTPATKSPQDAIVGYMVYRSMKPNDRKAKAINATRVASTTYVDTDVQPGKVYYYVTRAVSARGKLSPPSNETRAQIPR